MEQDSKLLRNTSGLLLAITRLLATSCTRAPTVRPKRTNMAADGQTVDVFYLMTRAEADVHARPHECGPVAPGMERRWMECARRKKEDGKMEEAQLSMKRAALWHEVANRFWPSACGDLAAGLPPLDAVCVIPSSRAERRDLLVRALRDQFPNAIEVSYSRSLASFGNANEDAIFQDLVRTDKATLLQGACVGVADDWAGDGSTLRAFIRRIRADHGAHLKIVGAVPGVSALPLKPQPRRTE